MASRTKNDGTNRCAHLPGEEGVVERRTGAYKEKGSKPVGSDSKRWLLGIRSTQSARIGSMRVVYRATE